VQPVLADFSGNPVFFASTGGFIGTVSGVAEE
jgi:biotin transporter BioY